MTPKIDNELAAFVVATSEIGVNALEFRREMSAEALNFLLFEPNRKDFSWQASLAVGINFTLSRENNQTYKVQGCIETILSNPCVRCLNAIDHRIHIDFSLRLLEKAAEQAKDENKEWFFDSESLANNDESDYTVSYFSNRRIDLAQILREQIFLVLPDYPQCGVAPALEKIKCETLIPLADVGEGEHKRENPFVKLLAKTKLV